MPASLYRRHDPSAQTRFQDLKRLAQSQARILAGTPGMLKQRTQSGKQYWVREYIRVDGKKTDEYIGPVASIPQAEVDKLKAEIELARALASGSANLRLFGYQRIDRKPAAVLAVLYNRKLIEAGLVIVGSHAYGCLLNELGVNAPGYKTQDVDLAHALPLSIALPEEFGFQELLNETGLTFAPVPGMPSRKPSASFKLPGAELLAVDLLVPGKKTSDRLLDFLIEDNISTIALSANQVIPIRIPAPERFVLHKLFSSQSRRADRDKIRKDLDQAAVLAPAIEDETPGRLSDTFKRVPRAAKTAVKRGAAAAAKLLEPRHPEAARALAKMAK